jgi:hypothetical protein
MKAITLPQPKASLLTLRVNGDPVTTMFTSHRSAPDDLIGQRIAIHASDKATGWGRNGTRTQVGDFEIEKDAAGLLLRGPLSWPYRLPSGAIVATATLDRCVRIYRYPFDRGAVPSGGALIDPGPALGGMRWTQPVTTLDGETAFGGWRLTHCEEERSYDDFTPGRWAWVVTDVIPVRPTPVDPAGGWLWDLPEDLVDKVLDRENRT